MTTFGDRTVIGKPFYIPHNKMIRPSIVQPPQIPNLHHNGYNTFGLSKREHPLSYTLIDNQIIITIAASKSATGANQEAIAILESFDL